MRHIPFQRLLCVLLALVLPRFTLAQCDYEWSDQFPSGEIFSTINAGVQVTASALYDDGSGPALYLAGTFEYAGGVRSWYFVRWDGFQWSNPIPGITQNPPPQIHALTVFDDGDGPQLVIAGRFETLAGVHLAGIGRWNGKQLSPMGAGLGSGDVYALAIFDSGSGPRLYAAGAFNVPGLDRIGRWNGTSWERPSPALGPSGTIYALAASNIGPEPSLYVGGSFSSPGSSNIIRFNGTSWLPMAGGATGTVLAIHAVETGPLAGLYIGGDITRVGGAPFPTLNASGIAKWSGTNWSTMGSGISGRVRAIGPVAPTAPPTLYVGGEFAAAGGVANTGGIAAWNGSVWSNLGMGIGEVNSGRGVYTMTQLPESLGGHLAVAGQFRSAGGVSMAHFATWDGTAWHRPGNAPSANRMHSPSDHMNAAVHALAVHDDGSGPALFVGGAFSGMGDVTAPLIAKWTGSEWLPLVPLEQTPGCSACAEQIRVLLPTTNDFDGGPALYVAGAFGGYNFEPRTYAILRWDGTEFTRLGSGLQAEGLSFGTANAMTFFDEPDRRSLVVVGRFAFAGSTPAMNAARWDGAAWSAMDDGFNDTARAVAVFDDGTGPRLFAAGSFTASGANKLNAVAVWAGDQWIDAGAGLSDPYQDTVSVGELLVYDDGSGPALYAAGNFRNASGKTANGLARWNGIQWKPVAHADNFFVSTDSAMAVWDDGRSGGPALFVAGGSAAGLARWDGEVFSLVNPSPSLGVTPGIMALAPFHVPGDAASSLFAGGRFGQIGDFASHRFAQLMACEQRCPADFDRSGEVNSADFFAFLAAFFTDDPAADINDDGAVTSADFFAFLPLFFEGCP